MVNEHAEADEGKAGVGVFVAEFNVVHDSGSSFFCVCVGYTMLISDGLDCPTIGRRITQELLTILVRIELIAVSEVRSIDRMFWQEDRDVKKGSLPRTLRNGSLPGRETIV